MTMYCFILKRSGRWDITTYTFTGAEKRIGTRAIDGAVCAVYRCPDRKYRAITEVSAHGIVLAK